MKSFDLGNYIKMEKSLKFGTVYIYIVYIVSLPFIFLYEIKEKIVIEIGPRLNPFTLITIGGSTSYCLATSYWDSHVHAFHKDGLSLNVRVNRESKGQEPCWISCSGKPSYKLRFKPSKELFNTSASDFSCTQTFPVCLVSLTFILSFLQQPRSIRRSMFT